MESWINICNIYIYITSSLFKDDIRIIQIRKWLLCALLNFLEIYIVLSIQQQMFLQL